MILWGWEDVEETDLCKVIRDFDREFDYIIEMLNQLEKRLQVLEQKEKEHGKR